MAIPTETRGEAYAAVCRDCDWTDSGDTSRQIRNQANRHAARKRHRVAVDYHTVLIVRGDKLGPRP